MGDSSLIIRPKPPETCGNCRFAFRNPQQLQVIECHGLPPHPVVIGQQQNLAGQVEAAIQLLRPMLPTTEPACALWKPIPAPGPPEAMVR